MSMREISYGRAGMEALVEEMRRDPTTLHLATDAAQCGRRQHTFGRTTGAHVNVDSTGRL